MSVLEYAIRVLKVEDVIVCGHYGCGGVRASLLPLSSDLPHVGRRIAPLCALARRHDDELSALATELERVDKLAELNVLETGPRDPRNADHAHREPCAACAWLDFRPP